MNKEMEERLRVMRASRRNAYYDVWKTSGTTARMLAIEKFVMVGTLVDAMEQLSGHAPELQMMMDSESGPARQQS